MQISLQNLNLYILEATKSSLSESEYFQYSIPQEKESSNVSTRGIIEYMSTFYSSTHITIS